MRTKPGPDVFERAVRRDRQAHRAAILAERTARRQIEFRIVICAMAVRDCLRALTEAEAYDRLTRDGLRDPDRHGAFRWS
jgi:hypothetical protein